MTKKLLFVSANQLAIPYPVYPLALAYLKTYLEQKLPDLEVRIFDFNLSDIEAYKNIQKEFRPDYIGVSLRNIDGVNSYDPVNFLSSYKKIIQHSDRSAGATVIIGGAGFSIFPENLFDQLHADYGISGEGEESLFLLINGLNCKTDVTNIPGLIYRKDGHIIMNPRKNFFSGMDLHFDDALVDYYWQKSGMLNIQTKRGCPFNCIYCTYPVIEGRQVRKLDTGTIIQTLKDLNTRKGINYVFFTDSVFNIDNDYNADLAEKIISNNIKLQWGAYFYPKGMTADLLRLLKRSGLTHIEFGTESICDQTLANYGKHFTVEDIVSQSELCLKEDIYYAHFLILGGYGETDATIDETFRNSMRIEHSVFFPYVGMRIYPGTKLYNYALAEGKISADDDLVEPKYYISDKITRSTLKERAALTGRRWSFPDEDISSIVSRMRNLRNKKGPLWEYMIR